MRRRIGRFVRTAAFYRGVLGGSRPWQGVFVLLMLGRLRRRFSGKEPVLVTREALLPGERVQISALGQRPRRRSHRRRMRKKAMKAAIAAQT
jgi:hypothetical protein